MCFPSGSGAPRFAKRFQDIFETIYFAACEASCELAASQGPYETYEGAMGLRGNSMEWRQTIRLNRRISGNHCNSMNQM